MASKFFCWLCDATNEFETQITGTGKEFAEWIFSVFEKELLEFRYICGGKCLFVNDTSRMEYFVYLLLGLVYYGCSGVLKSGRIDRIRTLFQLKTDLSIARMLFNIYIEV